MKNPFAFLSIWKAVVGLWGIDAMLAGLLLLVTMRFVIDGANPFGYGQPPLSTPCFVGVCLMMAIHVTFTILCVRKYLVLQNRAQKTGAPLEEVVDQYNRNMGNYWSQFRPLSPETWNRSPYEANALLALADPKLQQ